MLEKQAIWCQCASVFHIGLTVACVASFQSITRTMDLIWSLFLGANVVVLFCASEHGPMLGIPTRIWQWMDKTRELSLISTLLVWSGPHWSVHSYIGLTAVLSVVIRWIPLQLSYGVTAFYICCQGSYIQACCALLWSVSRVRAEFCFRDAVGKSIASASLISAYKYRALAIIAEGFLLWHVRCAHRFPFTDRWKPVLFSVLTMAMACLWSHFNIKKTVVSNNAIIKAVGHGMAASLTAANACEICKHCLTSLDMESSFDDGF